MDRTFTNSNANGLESEWSKLWWLDPNVMFLDHGAFGACPIPVLEMQQRFREQMERQPLRFFDQELEPLLEAARSKLAAFVDIEPCDLVFVPNATTGINSVLQSLKFDPGDELLTTDHEFKASQIILESVAIRTGAKVIVASIPFPIQTADCVIDSLMEKVSDKTRLVLISHVTSSTSLVLPVEQLIGKLSAYGISTLIDGAHALGMLPVNLRSLGATYYVSNCHKWLCSPKGAAFLYVQRDKQSLIHPLLSSYNPGLDNPRRSQFHSEFIWSGTDDLTPYLCLPKAIEFMDSLLPGGWAALMKRNHMLALSAKQKICETLDIPSPSPNEMIGSMISLPLPMNVPSIKEALLTHFSIEVPVIVHPTLNQILIRFSVQMYNSFKQYEYLAKVLSNLFGVNG